MSKPIYKLVILNTNVAGNLARKALPESEQKAMDDQEQVSREGVGTKTILVCDSAWADELHPFWGVLRFPDLQANIDHVRTLKKIGWLDYSDAFTLLGTAVAEPEVVTVPNPIYKLWILKNNPATALTRNLPKGLDALRWEKHNALYKENNSQTIMYCETTWCNEAYQGFGISAYPNIEANMKIMAGLNELGWPGYMECISYLGIAVG